MILTRDILIKERTLSLYPNSFLNFQSDRERRPIQTWSLVCETQLSRSIKCGTIFQLRQGNDVSLLCQIQKLPHFNIVEELLHSSSSNRLFNFNFKNNSETPV